MKIITTFKDEDDYFIESLTPKINIVDITDINTPIVELTSGNMVDVNNGFYAYDFSSYSQGNEYTVYIDADSDIENRFQYGILDKIDTPDFLNTLDTNIEFNLGIKELLRLFTSVLANKSSGGSTDTITFRDLNDTKDRITATVDENGNRLNVSIDTSD